MKLLNQSLEVKSTCDGGKRYQLDVDQVCPSMLIIWNLNKEPNEEKLTITAVSKEIEWIMKDMFRISTLTY